MPANIFFFKRTWREKKKTRRTERCTEACRVVQEGKERHSLGFLFIFHNLNGLFM